MSKSVDGICCAILGAACIVLFATEAGAQCREREVLRNHLTVRALRAVSPPAPVKSAIDAPTWKTITIGTFANSFTLLDGLNAAGCAIGDSAGQILARPAFRIGLVRTEVELVVVSVAELGFQAETVPLADIYTRARQLGFELAPAEVAPQLRLQYVDQPPGEFIVAMNPIKTWSEEPIILTVANFGAGLILIGRDGRTDAGISIASRFLFVRSGEAALARASHGLDDAATLAFVEGRP
jgi:hypothetical protein